MALTLYHLNPDTEKIGVCRAQKGMCPFSSANPHFTSKEATQAYYENVLESEYGIFGEPGGELSLEEDAVRRRLNLLPDEALKQLVWERFRFGGYTPREADQMVAKKSTFYVSYTGNQEMSLDAEDDSTQHTFMRGACAIFATEIHRATGWPMVVYSDPTSPKLWQGHVAVKVPGGGYLDASGLVDDPIRSFGADAKKWKATEVSSFEELRDQTANRIDGTKEEPKDLALLERFAVAKVAFDVLRDEGLLKE